MSVIRFINNKFFITREYMLLLLLFLLPCQLAAQTAQPNQTPPKDSISPSLPSMPKWIEDTTVDLTFKDADMVTLLDKIHEETGITILREGAPANSMTNLSFHGPLKSALDKIADNFDYIWTPSKKMNRSLLFKKRFRSLDEHPEWNEKEMFYVTEQVCRALQSPIGISEPHGNIRDLLHILYHKLSPEQLRFLYRGGKLSSQDLDATQILLLNQHIYCVALGETTAAWQHLRYRLANLKSAKLVLKTSGTYKALTLVLPPNVGGIPDSVIIRYYKEADFAPNAPEPSIAPLNPEKAVSLSVQARAKENAELSVLQRRMDIGMQNGRLVDLLREVSEHCQCKIAVADHLKEQHLSLWTRDCSVRLLMDLLAEQNEWEWTYTTGTGIVIVRRDTFVPSNLSEVTAAFKIALPPDYRHFLGWGVAADDWLKGVADRSIQATLKMPGGDVIAMRDTVGKKAIQSDYNDPMMLRIWPTQPQKFTNHEELDYKEWTPQTKNAVLWSLISVALEGFFGEGRGIDVIEGRLTPYEKNPELAVLQLGGPGNGQYDSFGYSSTITAPNGRAITMSFFWALSNASAPLPPPLQEVFKRY